MISLSLTLAYPTHPLPLVGFVRATGRGAREEIMLSMMIKTKKREEIMEKTD